MLKAFRTEKQHGSPDDSDDQILYGQWEWANITATRNNPIVRDVIPRMGLQLAVASAQDTLEHDNSDLDSVCDPGGSNITARNITVRVSLVK
jgi:hypothetical protein